MAVKQNAQQKSLLFQVKLGACTYPVHKSQILYRGLKIRKRKEEKKKSIVCLILSELPAIPPFCVLQHLYIVRKMFLIYIAKGEIESRKTE